MFSVQLDTTQDISVKDQCSIIVRYMNGMVQERLLAAVACTNTTGSGFMGLLQNVISKNNLDITNCIGSATDGAANMQMVLLPG